MVARQAHNLEVSGSIPLSATKLVRTTNLRNERVALRNNVGVEPLTCGMSEQLSASKRTDLGSRSHNEPRLAQSFFLSSRAWLVFRILRK